MHIGTLVKLVEQKYSQDNKYRRVSLRVLAVVIFFVLILIPTFEYFYQSTRNSGIVSYGNFPSLTARVFLSHVKGIVFDHKGHAWINAGGSVIEFDGENWNKYASNSGIIHPLGNPISTDKQGRIWVGSPIGVGVFDGQTWVNYTRENSGFAGFAVTTISFDEKGRAWIGDLGNWHNGGVTVFDGDNWQRFSSENSDLASNRVNVIEFDSLNRVWVGTSDGLRIIDGDIWKSYTVSNSGLINNEINVIAFDSQNRAWLATDSGISVFDGKNWINYAESNSGLSTNTVQALTIDQNDRVWIGVIENPRNPSGRGLHMFIGENWTIFNTANSGLVSNDISYLAVDTENRVWIGTESGLSIMDIEQQTVVPPAMIFLRDYFYGPKTFWMLPAFLISLWFSIYSNSVPGWFLSFLIALFSIALFGLFPSQRFLYLEINSGVYISLGGCFGAVIGGLLERRSKKFFTINIRWGVWLASAGIIIVAMLIAIRFIVMIYLFALIFN